MGTRMFAIVKDMLKSVYNLNELSLSDMLEAAFEMYPVRVVCADIIAPMMWEIGSMWERGEIMVVMEHFASNVVIAKLKALLHKQNTTTNKKGPVVIVGCAPEEYHEIGALIVSFFMSLNGWKVVYLGQNIPPTDLLNIVDTMDVHTIALSASSERSLSSLKVIGAHIASRAKKKTVEFMVGGRLLKIGPGILESIPSACTRSADELYAYCPPTHPTRSDTMVRGALDGSYSLIRESYRKMRLASERRKRTQYLLDQITDDSASTDRLYNEELEQELVGTMEKLVQLCGAEEGDEHQVEELPDEGPEKTETKATKQPKEPKEQKEPAEKKDTKDNDTDSTDTASSTSTSPTPSTGARSPTNSNASTSPSSSASASPADMKARLEKQKQQTAAMKEMLQKYKDGKKAAEDSIKRSRAFLNENRMVTAKKRTTEPEKKKEPEPVVIPPATPYVPPTERNRMVSQPALSKVGTTFLHMNDPAAEVLYRNANKDEPYFPKYKNMPILGDNSSTSSTSSLSDMDEGESGGESMET